MRSGSQLLYRSEYGCCNSDGYPMGVKLAHYCEQTGKNVREAVVEMGLMTVEEAKKLVDPMLMTNPHAAGPVVDAFKKEKKLI